MEMNLTTLWWCLWSTIMVTFVFVVSVITKVYAVLFLHRADETTTIIISFTDGADFYLSILLIAVVAIATIAAHRIAAQHLENGAPNDLIPERILNMWIERGTVFYIVWVCLVFGKSAATILILADDSLSQKVSEVASVPLLGSISLFVLAACVAGYCTFEIERHMNPDTMQEAVKKSDAVEAPPQVIEGEGVVRVQEARTTCRRRNSKSKSKKKKNRHPF